MTGPLSAVVVVMVVVLIVVVVAVTHTSTRRVEARRDNESHRRSPRRTYPRTRRTRRVRGQERRTTRPSVRDPPNYSFHLDCFFTRAWTTRSRVTWLRALERRAATISSCDLPDFYRASPGPTHGRLFSPLSSAGSSKSVARRGRARFHRTIGTIGRSIKL